MISVQLWSVRDELEQLGWEHVLQVLADDGFRHVEPFDLAGTAHRLAPLLAARGLTAPTGHGDLTGDRLPATVEAAATLGVQLVMHPSFPAERWLRPDGVHSIAEDLNRAAATASRSGMRVAFHNHDTEVRHLVGGVPAVVALMDLVGPNVGIEFDPYWATIGGGDVAALLQALQPYLFALHLKDGPTGGINQDQVAVGDGALDWRRHLEQVAPAVPRVIGLDEFSGDTLQAVLTSRRRLQQWGVPA